MYKMEENTVGYLTAVAAIMLIEEGEREKKSTRKTIAGVTYTTNGVKQNENDL